MTSKYQPGDVVDFDDIIITFSAVQAWKAVMCVGVAGLPQNVRPGETPIEQGLWLATGELEIFVEIPGIARVSMKIPPGQWTWR